jgi:uncharacterized membrane protein
MQSHFVLLVAFAFFVSLVFAVIGKDEPHEQFQLGALMFAGFVGAAVALGWLLYFLPF